MQVVQPYPTTLNPSVARSSSNAGRPEVVGHDFRTRRETRLDPRLGRQPRAHGVPRQHARRQHHRRVRGVGAARDRRDHDGAVPQHELMPVHLARDARRLVLGLCAALRVFGHHGADDVGRSGHRRGGTRLGRRRGRRCRRRELQQLGAQRLPEHRLRLRERHPVLRPLGSRQTRLHRRQVERHGVGVHGIGRRVGPEQSLGARIRFDETHQMRVARGERHVREGLGIDREESHRGPVLGRHVGDRRAVGQRRDSTVPPRRTRRTCPRLSSAAASASPSAPDRWPWRPAAAGPWSLKPTTSGTSIDSGWPSIAASASIPPTPHPTTPRPLIIVVCESVPTSESG